MKSIVAVILAIITGSFSIFLVQRLGHTLYPMPNDLDFNNKEAIRMYLSTAPFGSLIMVIVAWLTGSIVAGITGSLYDRSEKQKISIISGGILMAFALINLISIPYPSWMWISLLVFVPGAWIGSLIIRNKRK